MITQNTSPFVVAVKRTIFYPQQMGGALNNKGE